MQRLVTRVAPGLIVSTIDDGDRAQTVTFVSDPEHRSGANVVGVTYGPLSEAGQQHRIEAVMSGVMLQDAPEMLGVRAVSR